VSRQHRRLYCSGVVENSPLLVVVDTDADTIVGTMPVGSGGEALCVNETRDELYFSGPGDTVLVLDCSGDTIIRRLAAFPGRTIQMMQCLPERDLLFSFVYGRLLVMDLASGYRGQPDSGPWPACVRAGSDRSQILLRQ